MRIFTSLDDPEFNRLFHDFRFTAYRLETLQHYDVTYEREEFRRFLSGESRGEFPGIRQWIEGTVRPAVQAGKRIHRVHVVTSPPSNYVMFEAAWAYEHTSQAGEEIGLIPTPAGSWPPELSAWYDYWLFDSSVLVPMYYDDEGRFLRAEIVDDPQRIVEANRWRDAAVSMSVRYEDTRMKLTK